MMSVSLYTILLLIAGTYAHHDDLEHQYEPPPMAPRVSWLARPPLRPLPENTLPAHEVVAQHTGSEGCLTPGECIARVRDIQAYHMDSLGMDDIAYNFLIGGDGVVYVGRGWYEKGAHTLHHNQGTIGVAFVGYFEDEDTDPSEVQILAFLKLMTMGLKLNLISTDFTIVEDCDVMVSFSPKEDLFNQSLQNNCNTTEIDFATKLFLDM